jgi:hypothetical protein
LRIGIQYNRRNKTPVGVTVLHIEATLTSKENDINSRRKVTKKKLRKKIRTKKKE